MDPFISHETSQAEVRAPNVGSQPRAKPGEPSARLAGSRTPPSRLRRPSRPGGGPSASRMLTSRREGHGELLAQERQKAQSAMDLAIQNDLVDGRDTSEETLLSRLAALLAAGDGANWLDHLADLLEQSPELFDLGDLLRDCGEDPDLPEILKALAAHAGSTDDVDAVAPVVATLCLQSLPELIHPSHLERLLGSLSEASAAMAINNGAETLAVMPHILAVIGHHARRNELPAADLPSAILRITRQVAANPPVVARMLRQPSKRPVSQATAVEGDRSTTKEQTLILHGPAEITIRYLS